MRASFIVTLGFLTLASFGCASLPGRPAGEVVRYMARPPARTATAPAGAYALYQDPDDPPLLVVELTGGERVGFELSDASGRRELYALAGDEEPLLIDAGRRYSWKRAGSAAVASTTDLSVEQRREAEASARAAVDAAQRDYDQRKRQLEAAERRLEQAKERYEAISNPE